jgi:hypothetical protein
VVRRALIERTLVGVEVVLYFAVDPPISIHPDITRTSFAGGIVITVRP